MEDQLVNFNNNLFQRLADFGYEVVPVENDSVIQGAWSTKTDIDMASIRAGSVVDVIDHIYESAREFNKKFKTRPSRHSFLFFTPPVIEDNMFYVRFSFLSIS